LLKGEGYQTEAVTSLAGIFSALEKKDCALLIMDLNYARDTTSGQEGLTAIARIQEIDIPCHRCDDAWATIELAVEAMKRGARDFVQSHGTTSACSRSSAHKSNWPRRAPWSQARSRKSDAPWQRAKRDCGIASYARRDRDDFTRGAVRRERVNHRRKRNRQRPWSRRRFTRCLRARPEP